MDTEEQILYIQDNSGAVREWAISSKDDTIYIRHGFYGGGMQYQQEVISEGKSTRSVDEQMMLRMASRISKQRDKGYQVSLDHALNNRPTNLLQMPKPMLAQKIEKVKNIDYEGAIVQPKFDGNRCLIYCKDGVNRAYSRQGKPIEAITHILGDIEMPEGTILDGELYHHGTPLQTIVSWVKRKQPDTDKLKYHVYDTVSNLPYKLRSELIRGIPFGESISPVYGESVGSYEDVISAFRDYRADGYEGAIIRWSDAGYEDGKRSRSLVKVKEWQSDEFLVVSVNRSKDGWAVLVCLAHNGERFGVSAPGAVAEKIHVWENRYDYVGKSITVEYANLTSDGVPFHPVAINFRDSLQ